MSLHNLKGRKRIERVCQGRDMKGGIPMTPVSGTNTLMEWKGNPSLLLNPTYDTPSFIGRKFGRGMSSRLRTTRGCCRLITIILRITYRREERNQRRLHLSVLPQKTPRGPCTTSKQEASSRHSVLPSQFRVPALPGRGYTCKYTLCQ